MNSYTNGFTCSMSDNGEEVIIRFFQNMPSMDSSNTVVQEIVQTFYMTSATAHNLAAVLTGLFERNKNFQEKRASSQRKQQ